MPKYHRVVIIGVGLLGGSIGLALRQTGLARQVVGVGRSADSLQLAKARGAVDLIETQLQAACADADMVIIGTPVQSIAQLVIQSCQTRLAEDCVVTDVGSTKATITAQLGDAQHQRFCGSHPMAGSEKTGVAYATADLFQGRRTIVTPVKQTSPRVLEKTEEFWGLLGSIVTRMDPIEHDHAVASISHLPHVVAAALSAATPTQLIDLAGTGWSDTTRVAAGDVELWRQIISENRQPLLQSLRHYATSLDQWIQAIEHNDQARLVELLTAGKHNRDSLASQDV
jgi:prephenate dehydrogenase